MNIVLRGKDNVYQQIINEYKRFIILGVIKKNEKLPSCRQLASELGINPNTVAKAYNILEEEGFINVLPKKGVYVIYSANNDLDKLVEVKNEIIKFKNNNIEYEELMKIVNDVYRRGDND